MPASAYSPDQHRPLRAYAGVTAAFAAAVGGSIAGLRAGGRELPERIPLADVAMIGIATQKLSRMITKDKVTSWVRAPFTRFEEPTGQGEVSESARGEGWRLAVGELAVCPYCVAQWVVTAFGVAYVAAPRETRVVSSLLTAKSIADFAQLAYLAAEKRAG